MYEKVKRDELPKRERKSEYRFESTPAWEAMKVDIDNGLAPDEALKYTLTDEDKKKYRILNRRTVQRFIQEYLESKGKRYAKYQVLCRRIGGVDLIIVESGATR
jgi:hypothetical protein